MELQIWDGDWGLPTVDHHCLAVLAYCKFVNAPVDIKKVNNPWKTVSGDLPVLNHSGGVETKVRDIINFLQRQNLSADQYLTPREKADSLAFAALMEEKLLPALLHLWWVDTRTYVEFTRPWFANKLPYPLCWYLPMQKRNDLTSKLELLRGRESYTVAEQQEAQLLKDAKECLNFLSAKLGDKRFFHGERPTMLDALAFGYLGPLLNAPLPNATLQNHLKACHNLVQFCQRIIDIYFPLTPEEQEINKKLAEEAHKKLAETTEFPNKRRNIVIAVGVALAAMVAYALVNGLVQLEFVDVDKKPRNDNSTNASQMLESKEENED